MVIDIARFGDGGFPIPVDHHAKLGRIPRDGEVRGAFSSEHRPNGGLAARRSDHTIPVTITGKTINPSSITQ
jgi:hypothetical protein